MFKQISLLFLLSLGFSNELMAQKTTKYAYEISKKHPYGLVNPNAPKEVQDFEPLIGECDCQSVSRKPDGTWSPAVAMMWRFKYIMNGMAVQDETLKADQKHSGSIRQFNSETGKWLVHYYASGSPNSQPLPTWEGTKTAEGKIILFKDQKAPNGMEGMYRITFYEISNKGYNWIGEWVNADQTIVYPTWKIACKKRK